MNGNKANILGVSLDSSSTDSLLNTIVDLATNGSCSKVPVLIFTPNPEFVVEAQKDEGFKDLLNASDINLVDGFGLVLAGKVLKQDIGERISGADVAKRLLEVLSKSKSFVGIAGARGGILEEAEQQIRKLQAKYPNITFVNLDDSVKYKIQNTNYNVILAAHGMKKQEEWIWKNKNKIKANVFMGMGGSLDFLTGFSQRAPVTIRKIGLEWLWRAVQRPKHFERVWRATVIFGGLVIKEKLRLVFGLNSK